MFRLCQIVLLGRAFLLIWLANEDHLNRAMYEADITWQIVYFAPLDNKGQADVFNQLSVSSGLKKILMETMVLTGPNGTVYHILEVEGGPRESEVYITVMLQAEFTRPKEEFDKMQELHLKHKEG